MPPRRRRVRLARKNCYLQAGMRSKSWLVQSSSSMLVAELTLIFCLEIAGTDPNVLGESANAITTYGYDPATGMQEAKVTLCQIMAA